MSLEGRWCSCGGRNKSCVKCDGSGMFTPPSTRRGAPKWPKVQCVVCGRHFSQFGLGAHQRAKHPELHGGASEPASDGPTVPIDLPNRGPAKAVRRQS
jgi:hypothetical protein